MSIKIKNWNDLKNIEKNPAENFILVEDLDKNTKGYEKIVGNKGWKPINFNGVFNGNNHTIKDLKIAKSNHTGLFGDIEKNGVVKNLNMANIIIDVKNIAGILAAKNYGAVKNVTVRNSVINGENYVGGIVGENGVKKERSKKHEEKEIIAKGKIKNVILKDSKVNGGNYVGGITAKSWRKIKNARVLGSKVNGENTVGKIIGRIKRIKQKEK